MTETDLYIQELKLKIKKLEKQKESALKYINARCVYDEHIQGYCLGLSTGEVKTLVHRLTKEENEIGR